MIKLLKFSHDRKTPFSKSCNELREVIDAFAEQSVLDEWYKHFEINYALPKEIIKQQMKAFLASSYDYRKCLFLEKLLLKNRLKSLLKHFGFLIYVTIKSKKYYQYRNYELIVDWIESDIETKRFSKLISLFTTALIVNVDSATGLGYETIYRPKYKYYDRKEVVRTLFQEIKKGLSLYFKLSDNLGINLIPIATHIVNQYLYYYSLFKYNRAKYCMQERHYQTSAIKNHLFRKFGGRISGCIQKNIIQRGHNGFYYDIDVLFTLGNRTADRAFEYGARIKKVIPVGSLFMEYYWFGRESIRDEKKRYDVIYIGINLGSFQDSYEMYLHDYYEGFRWLKRLSKENPWLRIAIKHHGNNKGDLEEDNLMGCNIEKIDLGLNSYEVSFQSKCAVTFCSTMGYELIAHGIPCLFLDPGRRNEGYLPDNELLDEWRVTTYQEFVGKIKELQSQKKLESGESRVNSLCLNSRNVSENIYSGFVSNSGI